MTFNSVREIYQSINESRSRLRTSVEGLTDSELNFRGSPDRWSITEILEHLALVEGQLARLFRVMVAKAEAAQSEPHAHFSPVSIEELLAPLRHQKIEAPENARPTGHVSASESLARLEESRAALHGLLPRIEKVNGSSVIYPHPAAGPINLYQWLLFVGAHEDRHLGQIEAVKALNMSRPR